MGKIKLEIRAFEYADPQALAGVHSSEQISRPSNRGFYDVEGWIVDTTLQYVDVSSMTCTGTADSVMIQVPRFKPLLALRGPLLSYPDPVQP